jgi:1-acyl-sn-glycerol-3-phosphate acyltransferase
MPGEDLAIRAMSAAAPPLAGVLRMAGAAAGDVGHAVDLFDLLDDDRPGDPLDARNPDYIAATLPAMRLLCETYFRGEVRGLEHIPRDEPVLLVGNHSGGTLIADTFVFAQAFYTHFGPERRFHQLAHDLVFKVPAIREWLMRWGTVPASPENMRRALDGGAALLVYPGGDHETYRPTWESDKVDFAGRTGFVKLARELDVPVVPVVAIGGQETALFLGRGRRFARALQLDRLLRLKVLPVQIGPPFGLTVLDLPGRIPLPAKITIEVLPALDLEGEADVERSYRRVTETMQDALDDLADERSLPVIG